MSVLSNHDIKVALQQEAVVIEPFNEDNLSTSSYDVCLGEYYYREQTESKHLNVFNIYDQEQVQRVWGNPIKAGRAEQYAFQLGEDLSGFKDEDQIIILRPGESILAHTQEFIGGRKNITTMMKARSSLGRSFINVCQCAGWGDVGFVNRWTMEITNRSPHHHIPLLVGERIAQIVFFNTGHVEGDYTDKGSYQPFKDIDRLAETWDPSAMLPRTKRKNSTNG